MKKRTLFAMLPILGLALASCGNTEASTSIVVPTESTSVATTDALTTEIVTNTEADNTSEVVDDTKVSLSAKVVYPDGTPVEGVPVQWCAEVCYAPVTTNIDGVASISLDKTKDYVVHVNKLPKGYGYNPYELVENATNATGTITLFALNDIAGEGTDASPYLVTAGNYKVMLEANKAYVFNFTFDANTTYTIESYAVEFGTKIADYGVDNKRVSGTDGKGNEDNFKYTFTTGEDASLPRILKIVATSEESFYFSITKE